MSSKTNSEQHHTDSKIPPSNVRVNNKDTHVGSSQPTSPPLSESRPEDIVSSQSITPIPPMATESIPPVPTETLLAKSKMNEEADKIHQEAQREVPPKTTIVSQNGPTVEDQNNPIGDGSSSLNDEKGGKVNLSKGFSLRSESQNSALKLDTDTNPENTTVAVRKGFTINHPIVVEKDPKEEIPNEYPQKATSFKITKKNEQPPKPQPPMDNGEIQPVTPPLQPTNTISGLIQIFEESFFRYQLHEFPAGKSLQDSFWKNGHILEEIQAPETLDTTWSKKRLIPFLDGIAFLLSQLSTEYYLENKQNRLEAIQWLSHFVFTQIRDFLEKENLFILKETIPYTSIFDPYEHRAINAYDVPPDYIDVILEVHKLGFTDLLGKTIIMPEVIVGK